MHLSRRAVPFLIAVSMFVVSGAVSAQSIFGPTKRCVAASQDAQDFGLALIPNADASKIEVGTKASCTASCGGGITVSCSGSGACSAQDRNCAAGIRGQVTCGSTTNHCPPCPPSCTNGQERYVFTGTCCCDGVSSTAFTLTHVETCINGSWIRTGSECNGQVCSSPEICPIS